MKFSCLVNYSEFWISLHFQEVLKYKAIHIIKKKNDRYKIVFFKHLLRLKIASEFKIATK